MISILKCIGMALARQYTSIGGQAVIEGVMMRSPNAFIIAVRKPNGDIRLRKDQWFGLSRKMPLMNKPFLRGILMLIEAMANGIVALNYSANIAMEEELKAEALKQGKTIDQFENEKRKAESIDLTTFLTIAFSFVFGTALFVFVPHAATEGLNQSFNLGLSLDGFSFHLIDGLIKACVFVLYIKLISFIPDIKRVFQYHGAEHKTISTFEAGEDLSVENAKAHSTLHPRCGTSFIFFLLFISIIIFSVLFSFISIGQGLPEFLKHILAIIVKMFFMIPIAGIAYEVIKFAGQHMNNIFCRVISFPGMLLQKLTTKEPDDEQLEVAICSMKAALYLEDSYKLKNTEKKIFNLEEVDVSDLSMVKSGNVQLKDFLEK